MAILSLVIGIISTGMMQIMNVQGTIKNRTEMHTGVRNATELMQQEIGQAGRISLPASVTLSGTAGSQTATVSSTLGMFPNMYLNVDAGDNYETVQVNAVGTGTITTTATAGFTFNHTGAPVNVSGGFATGIVPPDSCTTSSGSAYCFNQTTASSYPNGSTGSVLKLYGDINRDGNILYVEYTCSPGPPSAPGYLYRNEMLFDAVSKTPIDARMVLVGNLLPNPGGTPCFQYQTASGNSGNTYVLDVAVTLTVQTQLQDPQTHQFQQETKALLNVSPRNVFETWELDTAKYLEKIQPMPASVTALLQ
ncbi:MAG TPA: hypothetical protein VM578_10980 [Candidatus Saccharimonadales bacterium]|nr:hypothetical protein [Candidatus Saccharimonadales bacterium]